MLKDKMELEIFFHNYTFFKIKNNHFLIFNLKKNVALIYIFI